MQHNWLTSCGCCLLEHEDITNDPAVYESQVKSREKELGPNHPDVAESLGNVAIVYNQQQEYDKAQPLLERALKIYEKAHGNNHPNVAHILTDLAVLHLEQVWYSHSDLQHSIFLLHFY